MVASLEFTNDLSLFKITHATSPEKRVNEFYVINQEEAVILCCPESVHASRTHIHSHTCHLHASDVHVCSCCSHPTQVQVVTPLGGVASRHSPVPCQERSRREDQLLLPFLPARFPGACLRHLCMRRPQPFSGTVLPPSRRGPVVSPSLAGVSRTFCWPCSASCPPGLGRASALVLHLPPSFRRLCLLSPSGALRGRVQSAVLGEMLRGLFGVAALPTAPCSVELVPRALSTSVGPEVV